MSPSGFNQGGPSGAGLPICERLRKAEPLAREAFNNHDLPPPQRLLSGAIAEIATEATDTIEALYEALKVTRQEFCGVPFDEAQVAAYNAGSLALTLARGETTTAKDAHHG